MGKKNAYQNDTKAQWLETWNADPIYISTEMYRTLHWFGTARSHNNDCLNLLCFLDLYTNKVYAYGLNQGLNTDNLVLT